MENPIVILDNGGSTIKVGLVNGIYENAPRIISNAVIRSKGDKATYIGHEFDECDDLASLHYRLPIEKGYVVDWDAQKAVWDGVFSDQVLNLDTTEASILVTEPYFNLPNIQEVYDQFIFEEYEFESYHRCTPASLIPHGSLFSQPTLSAPACMIIVDSGFSFTHVVPIMEGQIVWPAVKRLDVGGKLLTNQLKELVSFRQWNMMEETYVMNHVKESCCLVSTNFKRDLEACRARPNNNPIVREYVLPDQAKSKQGHVRLPTDMVSDNDQILVMNNETITIPEIIFRPDDIGLQQAGLPATIAHCISLLPADIRGMFWANIGLIGGTTKFHGFRERLLTELRMLAPDSCDVVIYESNDPITEAYKSAQKYANTPAFSQNIVTRAEYAESGSNASRRKFPDWRKPPQDSENHQDEKR